MNFLNLNLAKFFSKKDIYKTNVLMTYSDNLFFFGKMVFTIWAESIGKNKKGITAIHSIGTTDQHSQLQLYLQTAQKISFIPITTNHSNKRFKINNDIFKNRY